MPNMANGFTTTQLGKSNEKKPTLMVNYMVKAQLGTKACKLLLMPHIKADAWMVSLPLMVKTAPSNSRCYIKKV